MALVSLYTIYDRVAETSCPPFAAVNDGVALRQLKALLREVPPVDRGEYEVFLIGHYDEEDMRLLNVDSRRVEFPAESDAPAKLSQAQIDDINQAKLTLLFNQEEHDGSI